MATYKKEGGVNVKSYTADPDKTYPSAFEGHLYYNSSDGQFKFIGLGAGAWASGGNMNQVRGSNKGFGIQTAAISAGGAHENPGATSYTDKTESYNGSSWTEVGDLNVGRQAFGSLGTSTAGFCAAGLGSPGSNITNVESWDGSSWTETTDVNTARTSLRGCGTTTAALAIGGYNPGPKQIAINESWNGSSWTETGDMNTARSGAGNSINSPSTDSIIFGGYIQPPPNTANAETWNGTSWTEVSNLNAAKDNMGGSGDASTSALCFGGRTTANTESWNGSSWTEVANLALARGYVASGGSASSAIISGGEAPGSPYYKDETEEWTLSHAFKKVTTG